MLKKKLVTSRYSTIVCNSQSQLTSFIGMKMSCKETKLKKSDKVTQNQCLLVTYFKYAAEAKTENSGSRLLIRISRRAKILQLEC